MSNKYSPTSYFIIDPTQLATAASANYATDAFGPVIGSETTKYRVTSKVRATAKTKVFAVCKGRIAIQPYTGDDSKVNLILKPEASYSPLKIKYFIYRGVDKADWINGTNLVAKDSNNTTQPTLLQKIWDAFTAFNTALYAAGVVNHPPDSIATSLIGYDPTHQTTTSPLDDLFFNSNSSFQLASCSEGDYIGNFTGVLGLDIVLDYGEHKLLNQNELFSLDLAYARTDEYVFDLTTDVDPAQTKRYMEYIHQFLDAAAFWGSHIGCGLIKTPAHPTGTNINSDISDILNKYQTASKVYIYIQEERGRSYNYYSTSSNNRTLKFFSTSPESYLTNVTSGWPILIKDIAVPAGTTTTGQITLQYNVDTNVKIDPTERYIYMDLVAPNNDTTYYPISQNLPNISAAIGDTLPLTVNLQTNNLKYCSTFLMIYTSLTQNYPLANYYDSLWPVNFDTNLKLPTSPSSDLSYWATYDKSRVVNLNPQLNIGASIQNKVIVDTGTNSANATKQRKLFMAALKRNTNHFFEFDKLNVDNFTSGISNKSLDDDAYALNIFNDRNFSTYKGQFTDNSDSNNPLTVNALSLIHDSDFERKNSFFLLGITNEEYNKLFYDNIAVQSTQLLDTDSDNVFFSLAEVSDPNTNAANNYSGAPALNIDVSNKDFKKYRVGLKYEDNTGALATTPLYPTTTANNVYVYTLDGFYFYSKEYADYQTYYKNFAKAKVEFRTKIAIAATSTTPAVAAYNGEFGFDWLRVGDNGIYQNTTVSGAERSYQSIIQSGHHRPVVGYESTEYDYSSSIALPQNLTLDQVVSQMAYKELKREYKPIPTQNLDEQYYVHYLNLYSKRYSDSIQTFPFPPYSAELRVLVTINEPLSKLEFDYDRTLFTINTPILSDNQVTQGKVESINKTITITCLRDFNDVKQIRVLAYPIGVTNKDDAELAGMIMVGSNDALSRQQLKFVLVSVNTNIQGASGAVEYGSFNSAEKTNLLNALYQALIDIEIVDETLSLENESEFQNGGIYIVNYRNSQYIDPTVPGLYQYLQNKLGSRYRNYFTVFAFGAPTAPDPRNGGSIVGRVQNVGTHSVALYYGRGFMTLAHESLHGLGLRHTHRDSDDPFIKDPKQKFIYQNANELIYPPGVDPNNPTPEQKLAARAATVKLATDNYMSYSGDIRTNIWNWQNRIINYLLKKS